jgi:hypothetical protein
MRVGDYTQILRTPAHRKGQPLSPATKYGLIQAARQFFRDCQEWEWIPRRFDPGRALATPPTIKALLGPDPRVIADDIWAKLLWAGLNLDLGDLPTRTAAAWWLMSVSSDSGCRSVPTAAPIGAGRCR